jgi:hypothetical protein
MCETDTQVPDCPRAKELLDLPPNWAFRMGVRPLLLDGVNRERVLALEVEEEDLPQPDELPPLVRGIVETALSRAGYTVASVSLPDAVYAIGDPARSGYLKIGCGTAGDRRPDSELGCQSRLDEAKRWTAGQAYFAVPPFQVGAGLGEAAEAFIHAELRGRGRHVDGEWFRASAGEVKDLVVRFLGSLSRRC